MLGRKPQDAKVKAQIVIKALTNYVSEAVAFAQRLVERKERP
jgi:3-hydroxyisobutyrate dehydrogenase-like beta-hydroxyacid dehydrogenase